MFRLAAGYEPPLAAALPGRHLLVPLHVVVRAEDSLHRGAALGVHPPPLGPGVLEPDLREIVRNVPRVGQDR